MSFASCLSHKNLQQVFRVPIEKGDGLPEFDRSSCNVIVCDATYRVSMYTLNKIWLFCLDDTVAIRIATGDIT